MSRSVTVENLSFGEFESLLKKLIAEGIKEALTKQGINSTNKVASSNHFSSQEETIVLNRKQVAKRLNLSLPTLAKYSSEGLIPSYRIGKRVLYKEHEVIKALQVVHEQKYKKL